MSEDGKINNSVKSGGADDSIRKLAAHGRWRSLPGLPERLIMFNAGCALLEILPCESDDDICCWLSDRLSGGRELYPPVLEEFRRGGYVEKSGGVWRAADALRAWVEEEHYSLGGLFAGLTTPFEASMRVFLRPAFESGIKAFALWGLNEFAEAAAAELMRGGAKVACFIDNSPEKRGVGPLGIEVMGFDEAVAKRGGEFGGVIVCSKYRAAEIAALVPEKYACFRLFAAGGQHAPAGGEANKIVAISFPKSGTFLLSAMLESMPGMSRGRFGALSYDAGELATALGGIGRGEFLVQHIPWTEEAAAAVRAADAKVVFLLRDPRDVLVSSLYFFLYKSYLQPFQNLFRKNFADDGERLMYLIRGDGVNYASVRVNWGGYLKWMEEPDGCAVRFETLVSGDKAARRREAAGIAAVAGIELDDNELDAAAAAAAGGQGSPTFRDGVPGAWRGHFTPEHKRAFKEIAGDLLISLGYEKDMDW